MNIFIDFSENKAHGLLSILDLHLEKPVDKDEIKKTHKRVSPEALRSQSKTDPRNLNNRRLTISNNLLENENNVGNLPPKFLSGGEKLTQAVFEHIKKERLKKLEKKNSSEISSCDTSDLFEKVHVTVFCDSHKFS